MNKPLKQITIVIVVSNDHSVVDALSDRLSEMIEAVDEVGWQIIVVDNGSDDDTVSAFVQHQENLPLTILRLSRRFGYEYALRAGLDHTDADGVIIMAADRPYSPELIRQMIQQWQQGSQIVYAESLSGGREAIKLLDIGEDNPEPVLVSDGAVAVFSFD